MSKACTHSTCQHTDGTICLQSKRKKYKFGKQKKTLEPEAFAELMLKGHFAKISHRAFLVLLYYTGCRVSEILKLTIEDFEITNKEVHVNILASKKGVERPTFTLALSLPEMDWVYAVLKKTKKGSRPFPFSRQTAHNIVKRVLPHHYPHFFRLNRVVSFLNQGYPQNKIRIWFGWKKWETINNYLGYSKRTTEELSEGLE